MGILDRLGRGRKGAGSVTIHATVEHLVLLPQVATVVQVVGESHYQSQLSEACGGYTDAGPNSPHVQAVLVPDPTNPYDPNAVAIQVHGMTVGYLDRHDAARYQPMLLTMARSGNRLGCQARVKGGYLLPHGLHGSLGIELYLPPPEGMTVS